jgi:predicted aspartyl protease
VIRVAALMILLLCLAACATAPPASPAACTVDKVAEVPAHLLNGALVVPAAIDHHAVQMQVDTGASRTTVTPDMAAGLALRADRFNRTVVHSIGGETTTRNTRIETFEVGDQVWSDESFVTSRLARNFDASPPVAGLLGADHLSDFDVELDLPRQRMTLWQVQGCTGDFAFHGIPHWRMQLERYWPDMMVAHVQIDGQPVSALIDWGANTSVLKQTVAARLGIAPEMLQADPVGHGRGADRNEIEYRVHRFSALRIGPGVFHNVRLSVGGIHAMNVDMLLGLDYARTRRLWLSYATGQLFVALPPQAIRSAVMQK